MIAGTLGDWMKQRRKALDISQADLARKVGCSVEHIRKVERGVRRPSREIALLIAEALGIPPGERAYFTAELRETTLPPLAARPSPPMWGAGSAQGEPHLIERASELAQIRRLLLERGCRLLTLFGPGGVGKTELALTVTYELAAHYQHGTAVAMLSAVQSTTWLGASLSDALTLPLYCDADPITEILNYLREKHLLLLLDNFDHLMGATETLERILITAPRVTLLITSRERLNLSAESALDLHGLSSPVEGEPVTEDYGAVALFCREARRIVPGFSITTEARSVAAICRHVRGMPLAIEMAASWLRYMPCAAIAEQITQNALGLTTTNRNVPSRHRSMKAVFDQSWTLLNNEEQRALMALSVFAGAFDVDAALQVADVTASTLRVLADKALLNGTFEAAPGGGHISLHPLVRGYAAERLAEAGLEPALRSRHLAYFHALAQRINHGMLTDDQLTWFSILDLALDDLRAAMKWASTANPAAARMGLEIATNMYLAWASGRIPEGKRWLFDLAPAVPDLKGTRLYAEWLWVAGGIAWFTGDNATAYAHSQEAIALHRALVGAEDVTYVWYLTSLGWVQKTLGMFAESAATFQACVDLGRMRGPEAVGCACMGLANVGEFALMRGDLPGALACLETIENIPYNPANLWSVAWVHLLRGLVALATGRYAESRAEFDVVIGWRAQWQATNFTALFLNYAAEAALRIGQYGDAIAAFAEAQTLAEEFGNLNGAAYGAYNVAYAESVRGDRAAARAALKASLRTNDSIGNFPGILITLSGLGELALAEGDMANAARLIGYVGRHYQPIHNTIFSLRRVEPEALRARVLGATPDPQIATLLAEGAALIRREAIWIGLSV
jgi:predicted ATPase/DNA-binding XRE family transcriptional regulator